MYELFAHLWYLKMLPLLEIQSTADAHSPNNVRVNATLSSNEKFYEIYNITEKDEMYISKDDRVKCW